MNILAKLHQIFLLVFAFFSSTVPAAATTPVSGNISHLGPTITVTVQRGAISLPIYWVNHLRKGDKLIVTTDQAQKTDMKWLLLLATITPITNLVTTRPFDLSGDTKSASITIDSDDQTPIIVIAPQVRTMFGIHTSFSESSRLISDAIQTDPQRFIDLQKIDQINHAINYLLHVLNALIQTKKADQAVDATKTLAAKFGVKYVDPDCFKDSSVNTKCVAAYIVSSADLTVPSDDIWSAAGPNPDSVKLPTDFFDGLKLMTETSTYLANKYGDNYDFAPSLGQRLGASAIVQLFTNARFKSGDIKTAYVYVPGWFDGKTPEIRLDNKTASCLTKKEMTASVKGNLPLLNYWHDWNLVLREHDSDKVLANYQTVDFKPDAGLFTVDYNDADLPFNGQILDATLTGKFGFADVKINSFRVTLPTNDNLRNQVSGLENLISGEQATLAMKVKNGNTCIEQMNLQMNNKLIATTKGASPFTELHADLSKIDPGAATLEIQQYGAPKQEIIVSIFKRKAHLKKISHHDLETILTVSGDNLDRIDLIQLANNLTCHPLGEPVSAPSRIFECPAEMALNANFPDKVTIQYQNFEPAAFDFPVSKMTVRPHMVIDGANAIITTLSATALQWNLSQTDQFVSADSGMGFLLHAYGGYKLSRGAYQLQLKFSDDLQTESAPISIPLMSDLAHNELRTKKPVTFESISLPSMVNPVWYRVQHQPSGLTGDWQPLNRSIIYLPQLTALSCTANATLVHGTPLELIDWASASDPDGNDLPKSVMTQCDKDQCLELNEIVRSNTLKVKLHWIDNRLFDVNFPSAPNCSPPK